MVDCSGDLRSIMIATTTGQVLLIAIGEGGEIWSVPPENVCIFDKCMYFCCASPMWVCRHSGLNTESVRVLFLRRNLVHFRLGIGNFTSRYIL